MARFVSLTVEDPAYVLVTLLNRLNGVQAVELPPREKVEKKEGEEEVEEEEDEDLLQAQASSLGKLVLAKDYYKLLKTGFFATITKILASPADLQAAFSIAFSLLSQVTETDKSKVEELVTGFVKALTKDPKQDNALEKIQLMSSLFNMLDVASKLRFTILTAMLNFALASENTPLLKGHFGQVNDWIAKWDLSAKEKSDFLGLLVKVCTTQGDSAQVELFVYKYLGSLDSGDKKQVETGMAFMSEAVVNAVRAVDVDKLDVLIKLPSAALLKAKLPAYYSILEVFARGDVASYNAFQTKNADFMTKTGLSHDKCLFHIRTLSLCSLGADQNAVAYAELIQALNVKDSDEMESVVIEAVTSGKIKASIDQETETVIMKGTTTRTFNEETDWASLQEKLDKWKSALVYTVDTLKRDM